MDFEPFEMERWQSLYENHVDYNLSESGVHPLTVGELLELGGGEDVLSDVLLGYGQTDGSVALKETIAAKYPGATSKNVTVTTGGAEANFLSLWHLMEPGQPVAVMLPNYQQVEGIVRSFRGEVAPFRLEQDRGWAPDLDALEAALGRGARVIYVTNPNNPTGSVLSHSDQDRIAELASAHQAWIVSDEVYRGAEVGDEWTRSFWGLHDKVLVTNSLSKAYGLPGLRLGWVLGPDDAVDTLWARKDYTTIGPSAVSDRLTRLALSDEVLPRVRSRTQEILRKNLRVLEQWIDNEEGEFTLHTPKAGALAIVSYRGSIPSSELAEHLRQSWSLLVVPGSQFGLEGTLRIGYGIHDLGEALSRLTAGYYELTQ